MFFHRLTKLAGFFSGDKEAKRLLSTDKENVSKLVPLKEQYQALVARVEKLSTTDNGYYKKYNSLLEEDPLVNKMPALRQLYADLQAHYLTAVKLAGDINVLAGSLEDAISSKHAAIQTSSKSGRTSYSMLEYDDDDEQQPLKVTVEKEEIDPEQLKGEVAQSKEFVCFLVGAIDGRIQSIEKKLGISKVKSKNSVADEEKSSKGLAPSPSSP